MASNAPVGKSQFDHVHWNVNNKSTNYAGKIFIALAVITALGAVATFAMHGGIASIGSDVMIFGGGAAALSGLIYGGLKIRDKLEERRAKKAWEHGVKDEQFEKFSRESAGMVDGSTLIEEKVAIGKEKYFLEGKKGGDHIKIYTRK